VRRIIAIMKKYVMLEFASTPPFVLKEDQLACVEETVAK